MLVAIQGVAFHLVHKHDVHQHVHPEGGDLVSRCALRRLGILCQDSEDFRVTAIVHLLQIAALPESVLQSTRDLIGQGRFQRFVFHGMNDELVQMGRKRGAGKTVAPRQCRCGKDRQQSRNHPDKTAKHGIQNNSIALIRLSKRRLRQSLQGRQIGGGLRSESQRTGCEGSESFRRSSCVQKPDRLQTRFPAQQRKFAFEA